MRIEGIIVEHEKEKINTRAKLHLIAADRCRSNTAGFTLYTLSVAADGVSYTTYSGSLLSGMLTTFSSL